MAGAELPLTSPGCNTLAPLSIASRESGLWLWHGEAPPPTSPLQLTSRLQLLGRIGFAVRQARRMALTNGLAVALLAASVLLYSTPPEEPLPADKPAVATQLVSPPLVAPPIVPGPPVSLTDPQSGQAQVASAPASRMTVRATGRQVTKWHAHRRSAAPLRKSQASFARGGPPMFAPMTWHGGGY